MPYLNFIDLSYFYQFCFVIFKKIYYTIIKNFLLFHTIHTLAIYLAKRMKNTKIIIAESQGFCFGVRRALQIVEKKDEILILGDLIHNKKVIDILRSKGKYTVYEMPKTPQCIAITAHGNKKEVIEDLHNKGFSIIDTTCPLVQNIYRISKKLEEQGYFIVILGDKKHIEVQGIYSRLNHFIVLEDKQDIDAFDLPDKIGVICQSTFSLVKFKYLSDYIVSKGKEVKVVNTICSPTKQRQNATNKLMEQADVMIVIGGFHSSNTVKLYQLSKEKLEETYHITNKEQLKKEWFLEASTIGIVAGASTPQEDIIQAYEAIQNMIKQEV